MDTTFNKIYLVCFSYTTLMNWFNLSQVPTKLTGTRINCWPLIHNGAHITVRIKFLEFVEVHLNSCIEWVKFLLISLNWIQASIKPCWYKELVFLNSEVASPSFTLRRDHVNLERRLLDWHWSVLRFTQQFFVKIRILLQ